MLYYAHVVQIKSNGDWCVLVLGTACVHKFEGRY